MKLPNITAYMGISLVVGLSCLLLVASGCGEDYEPDIAELQSELEAANARIALLEESRIKLLLGERKREVAKPSSRRAVRERAECEIDLFFDDSVEKESLIDLREKDLWAGLNPYTFGDPDNDVDTITFAVEIAVLCALR